MLVYDADALRALSDAYLAATGISPARLGLIVAGNDKLFTALRKGNDCTTASAAKASYFFDLNWPPTATWPDAVYRRPIELLYATSDEAPAAKASQRRRATAAGKSRFAAPPRRTRRAKPAVAPPAPRRARRSRKRSAETIAAAAAS